MKIKEQLNQKRNLLNEFLYHAPKMVCDFEKAIQKKDKKQIIFLSKLNRTLFRQIQEHQIADEFDYFAINKKVNIKIAKVLIQVCKTLISTKEAQLSSIKAVSSFVSSDNLEICLSQLRNLKDSAPNFISEIIDLYGQQNVECLHYMKRALNHEQYKKVRKIAHTMKSSFIMIGCKSLKNLAVEIEIVCEGQPVNSHKLQELFKEYDILVKDSIHLLKKTAKQENLL